MKIFHILKHTMHGAGNACAAVDLACTQARLGHDVYMCSSVGSFDALLSRHGVTSISLDQIGNVAKQMAALLGLHRILRRVRPDIVHAHMMGGAVLATALRPLHRFKLVTTVHNEFQKSAILMGLGQRMIGVSTAVSEAMIGRGIPRSRVRTVLNGTIHSPRRPNPAPPARDLRHPAIVTIGGMHPRKGIPDLLAAHAIVAASCPTAHLYLVGTGPMQAEYQTMATKNAGSVTFLGHLDDPRPILLGADVFVLASHADPAPLVLCEAREAGCAIVATEVDGIPELLDNGAAGIMVPPHRPDALAAAILSLLQDPARLAAMREKASTGLERFTMERVAADVERVYRELLP